MTKQDFYRGLYDATGRWPYSENFDEDYDEGYTIGELCNAAAGKAMAFADMPVHAVFYFAGHEHEVFCKRSETTFGCVDDPTDVNDEDVPMRATCVVCEDQMACRGMIDE